MGRTAVTLFAPLHGRCRAPITAEMLRAGVAPVTTPSAPSDTKDFPDGPQDHLDVEPDRPVLDVVVVEPGAVGDRGVPAQATDLCKAGQAGGYPMAVGVVAVLGRELFDEVRPFRPRTHQCHVTDQDVPQLGKLIQGGPPQEPANRPDAWIVRHRPGRG